MKPFLFEYNVFTEYSTTQYYYQSINVKKGLIFLQKMIYYGKNIVYEIIKSKRFKISKIFITHDLEKSRAGQNNITNLTEYQNIKSKISKLSKNELTRITNTTNHQNIAVKVEQYPYLSIDDLKNEDLENKKDLYVMFDSIQDPQNFGSAIRNCYCFGCKKIIIQNRNSVDVTAVVMKTSAGAAAYMNIYSVVNLSRVVELFKNNFVPVYALDIKGQNSIEKIKWELPLLLIVGSEDKGIRNNILNKSDFKIKIQQKNDFNSLNLSSSLAVTLYEMTKTG